MNLSLRSVTHAKEWEIDPDYLEVLSYENYFFVNLSKFLRNTVEFYVSSSLYWNLYILNKGFNISSFFTKSTSYNIEYLLLRA